MHIGSFCNRIASFVNFFRSLAQVHLMVWLLRSEIQFQLCHHYLPVEGDPEIMIVIPDFLCTDKLTKEYLGLQSVTCQLAPGILQGTWNSSHEVLAGSQLIVGLAADCTRAGLCSCPHRPAAKHSCASNLIQSFCQHRVPWSWIGPGVLLGWVDNQLIVSLSPDLTQAGSTISWLSPQS